jgi:hypothetical protein
MGQAEWDRQNGTDRTGQAEQDRQNGTGRRGKAEEDRQKRNFHNIVDIVE